MNQDLISIIVPVYGVEKYLHACVDSILAQTYQNLEVILIDDGSPDNCGVICDEYALCDGRVKVIHKPNGGAASARNKGLDAARGDYICLIDSDDWVSHDFVEKLYQKLTQAQADISVCSFTNVFRNGETANPMPYPVLEAMSQVQFLERFLTDWTSGMATNKMFKSSLLPDVRYAEGHKIDDEFFTYRVIARCRRLAHSDRRMYAYRQQPGSVMHLSFALSRLQAVDAKEQRLELLEQQFPELVPLAKTNLWYTCLYQGQMALRHLNETDRRTAFGKLKSALDRHPLTSADRKTLPLKQQVWHHLTGASFILACRLRNLLKIGI